MWLVVKRNIKMGVRGCCMHLVFVLFITVSWIDVFSGSPPCPSPRPTVQFELASYNSPSCTINATFLLSLDSSLYDAFCEISHASECCDERFSYSCLIIFPHKLLESYPGRVLNRTRPNLTLFFIVNFSCSISCFQPC